MSIGHPNAIEIDKSLFDELKELTFDTFTILVSLLDILSDIYITYIFWQHAQYTYFYISTAILIITHLSYCILFVYLFKRNSKYAFIYTLILLPISPFLSFVLYFTAKPESNKLSKYLHELFNIENVGVSNVNPATNEIEQRDPNKRWIEYNFRKHIGFIFESFIESFSSFVFQLYVLLMSSSSSSSSSISLSILFSLLSISMSLYLFCHSIYWKVFIFNYLCVISDIMKLFTLIIMVNTIEGTFIYIWCIKLLFITASSALYLSMQFIWNKIDGDLNSDWYQITRNFGGGQRQRRRSISRSQSKSKSKSNPNQPSLNRDRSKSTSTHLSTYHISDNLQQNSKNQRRHRSKLWHFIESVSCISSSQMLSEILFIILFGALVLLLWPFMILFLEISSFSLIAFVIDRFNTSRFLAIHWNLWQFIFAFLLRNKKNINLYTQYAHAAQTHHVQLRQTHSLNSHPSSRSMTMTTNTLNTMHTLSPTDSVNDCCLQLQLNDDNDISLYADADENDIELSQISQISQQNNNGIGINLDATELEVRLNTLANSGGYKRNRSITKRKEIKIKHNNNKNNKIYHDDNNICVEHKDIPWNKERDVVIRLATINYILAQYRESKKLYKYLDASLQSDCFASVELKELRYYSSQGMTAYDAIFRYHHRNIIEKWYALTKHKNANNNCNILFYLNYLRQKCQLLLKWMQIFVIFPSYFVSQILFLFSPYILFLSHHQETHEHHKYLYILYGYSLFVVALFTIFPSIYKFTKITSYIHHNCILYFSSYNSSFNDIERKIILDINHLYQNLVATQIRSDCLTEKFGVDVCLLILSYLPRFHVVNDSNNNAYDDDIPHLHQLHNDTDHDENDDLNNLQICVTPAKSQCSNNENHENCNENDHENNEHLDILLTDQDQSGYENDTDADADADHSS